MQRPFTKRVRRSVESRGTPVVAKQPEKGNVVPDKTVDVDATTGFSKSLIKTGKAPSPVIDNPVVDETVTFEDKVVAPK